MKQILLFTIFTVFTVGAFGQSFDTLTLKDCRCVEYDAEYNICDVVLFTNQGICIGQWFIVRDFITTFTFNQTPKCGKDPHSETSHPATTNFFGIDGPSGVPQFGTLIFYVRKPKRA